jgi:hypothetical protein|tara:strand:+ start:201 stop:428 length:228 start_codon:yes stop_codon:yes gene_type:complete
MTNQKQFNVTYVQPNGMVFKSMEVPASRLFQNDSGETRYRFNDRFDYEVISVEEVSQDYLDAKRAYFNKYGTACE